MSQTDEKPVPAKKARFPKLTICNRPEAEGSVTTGSNVQILLDGQKLPFVSFLKLELKPSKVAKVMIEMFVQLDADINLEKLGIVDSRETDFTINKKTVEVRTLSNHSPAAIGIKK